jgi:saccharopine dehydrogenase (NADP+, L-glutamate forming)
MKKVLLLGAGFVARPLARYLLAQDDLALTVVDQVPERAAALVDGAPHGSTSTWTNNDPAQLRELVDAHDLVVSLLPAPLHPIVAEACVERGKHFASTSYVSPAMKELDEGAQRAGVTLLNEMGVDPGLDHMSAMRVIDAVHSRGGKIMEFRSCCGGLPAPKHNDNPWGYKFAWSPRAVCTASKQPAQYRHNGQTVELASGEVFGDSGHGQDIEGVGALEAYPNRNSLGYIDLYGLTDVQTMLRGTFRYPGWSETLTQILALNLLDEQPVTYPAQTTYAQWLRSFLTVEPTADLRADVARQLSLPNDSHVLDRFAWLGLFSDEVITPVEAETTALDILAQRMERKMQYGSGEQDMIVLHHDFVAEYPAGQPAEHITSTLIAYGESDGDSAMSRTVGLPAAVGAKLILSGELNKPGVRIPVVPEIYEPVLRELATMGIEFQEHTRPYQR